MQLFKRYQLQKCKLSHVHRLRYYRSKGSDDVKQSLLIIGSALLLVLCGCSSYQFKADTDWEIAPFTMTDHRGNTVTNEDLKGQPYLAMFMFTSCITVCSPMTYNMTQIQQKMLDAGLEKYHIVGFSVDPTVDTPQKLTEYLNFYDVPDEEKWHLLTGYDEAFIAQFAKSSFKTLVQDDPNSDQVIHAVTFFLVDENGVAIKNYRGYAEDDSDVPMEQMARDVEALLTQ